MCLDDDLSVAHLIEIILVHFQLAPVGHNSTRFFIVSNRVIDCRGVELLSSQRTIRPICSLSHILAIMVLDIVDIFICFQVALAEIYV